MADNRAKHLLGPTIALSLAWTALALVYAVKLADFTQQSFLVSLKWASVTMALAAVLGTGVWMLAGRWTWPGRITPGFALKHLAAGAAYSWIWVSVDYIATFALKGQDPFAALLARPLFSGDWAVGALIYGMILGGSYAIRTHRAFLAQQAAARRAEQLAAEARTNALRAQLNPHFLFNALHALGPLVRRDQKLAEEALDRLGDLLRYALDDETSGDVTFAEEWAFTQNYLELERLRLGPRLRTTSSIDPAVLGELIPSLSLQPLAENAIRHGIAPRDAGATLSISARLDVRTSMLVMVVADTGDGASGAAVQAARGLGLRSLRERLAVQYAGRATLDVDCSPGGGFTVRVCVPVPAPARRAEPRPELAGRPFAGGRGPRAAVQTTGGPA